MRWTHFHFHHHWHHHRRRRVLVAVDGVAVELIPNGVIHMTTTLNVGQKLPLSIVYLDQTGQPMQTTPTPDAAPQWAQTTPATESLTAAPDGLTAEAEGLAAGSDTISLSLTVGGVSFSAILDVVVSAVTPTQTLTSIQIVAGRLV